MYWVKAFHIIFMVTWFAGLFYLPRLYVYHAMCDDAPGSERFKVMERKLFYGIMTPSAILTVVFGLWMLWMGRKGTSESPAPVSTECTSFPRYF